MKLNIFNRWKPLGSIYGRQVEFQSAPTEGSKNVFVTILRDTKTQKVITKAYGKSKENSLAAATALIRKIGGEAVWQAIETGEPVLAARPEAPKKEVQWSDGIGHASRASKKIVGENNDIDGSDLLESKKKDEETKKPRNFVAKHARKVNKAGPMKDKTAYTRKPKHKGEEGDE